MEKNERMDDRGRKLRKSEKARRKKKKQEYKKGVGSEESMMSNERLLSELMSTMCLGQSEWRMNKRDREREREGERKEFLLTC